MTISSEDPKGRLARQLDQQVAQRTSELARLANRLSQEVEERLRVEQALRDWQQRVELGLKGSRVGLWDWDLTTGEVRFVRHWAEILGYGAEETEDHVRMWERHIHPDDKGWVMQAMQDHLDQKTPYYETLHRIRAKSGQWRWVLDRGQVISRDAQGRPIRAAGMHADLTEYVRALHSLDESNERFRMAFEEGPIGMAFVSTDDVILGGNRSLFAMLGYTEDELRGRHLAELTHPDDLGAGLEQSRRLLRGEISSFSLEKRYLRKGGEVIWGRLTACFIRNQQGEILYGMSMIEDITARRQAEVALRRAERLASIGTMAAGIAHEVNNPLGAIALFAEAALQVDSRGDPARLRICLERIRDEAMRAGQIVRNVLRLTRNEPAVRWAVNCNELVVRTAELIRPLAAQCGVHLDVALAESLPEIQGDSTELSQVLINLLTNAIQASASAQTVQLRTTVDQGGVCIEVQDFGQGMNAEQTSRMFDPFFTTRLHEGGTGLGLSIVHGIVQDHGGEIEVQSHPGKGTLIRVRLPLPEACTGES